MLFGIGITGFLQFLKTAILVVRIYYWNKFISWTTKFGRRKDCVGKICEWRWRSTQFAYRKKFKTCSSCM